MTFSKLNMGQLVKSGGGGGRERKGKEERRGEVRRGEGRRGEKRREKKVGSNCPFG